MEEFFERIPFVGKLVISFLLSVAIPGSVSFAILKTDVETLQAQANENKLSIEQIHDDNQTDQRKLYDKLEEIQRSIGRLEGKIERNER